MNRFGAWNISSVCVCVCVCVNAGAMLTFSWVKVAVQDDRIGAWIIECFMKQRRSVDIRMDLMQSQSKALQSLEYECFVKQTNGAWINSNGAESRMDLELCETQMVLKGGETGASDPILSAPVWGLDQ